MSKELKKLHQLLKGHKYVFLDEEIINVEDIEGIEYVEEEINYKRNKYMDNEELLVPVYLAKEVKKPNFDFDDIGEKLESRDYEAENAWGTDLVIEDEEVLKKINELVHSIIAQVYNSDEELFSIVIYADEERGFKIVKKENKRLEKGNYKIDVSSLNPAEREKFQKELFRLGFKWFDGGQEKLDLDADFLFLHEDKDMTCCETRGYFERYDSTPITVEDVTSALKHTSN